MRKLILFLLIPFIIGTETKAQDNNGTHWVTSMSQNMSADFKDTPFFRLPKMVVCNNGDIVIGCEAKGSANKGRALFHAIAISTDGGNTFKARRSDVTLHELVYDGIHDRIFSYAGTTFFASDDQGRTWYDYKSKIFTKLAPGFDEISMSPTTGIQLKNGILAIPMRCIKHNTDEKGNKLSSIDRTVNFVLYSKDYGKTWKQTAYTDESIIADEVIIVEYADNQIMLNSRGGTEASWKKTNNGRRVFIPSRRSKSSIDKWEITKWKTEKKSDGKIYDPICNASIIKAKVGKKNVALFCNPDMPGEYWPRKNLRLMASKDFKHWKKVTQLTPDDYPVLGYTTMGYYEGNLYFAYEDEAKGLLFCNLNIYNNNILKAIK